MRTLSVAGARALQSHSGSRSGAAMGESAVIVNTRVGGLRGGRLKGSEGDEYLGFKGVPYAKPPVGELRFKDPEPMEPWTGVRDATVHGPNCAQFDLITNENVGSDDCLYLNVYTKSTKTGIRRPVMVWIHGGGFVYGHGDDSLYGPDYFMCKDVVMVTINYRVGVLGFLNLNDEAATGNQGLKDQVMALQWVRDNIDNFGGDPENITIFGESAGSASVHYLTISPLVRGLFHKAIAQSGAVLNAWAFHPNPQEKAYQLCEQLGHTDRDPQSIVQFLREIDIRKIIEVQEKLLTQEERLQFAFTFGPSIDSKSKNPFMPVHPEIAAAEGIHVPLIIGHTSREAIFFLKTLGKDHDRFNTELDKLLHPNAVECLKHYDLTVENVKRFYFRSEPITEENLEKLIDLLGDLNFVEGIHRTIKTQVEKGSAPTYFYQYTYDKEPSFMKMMYNAFMSGASHADELQNLFHAHFFDTTLEFPKKGSEKYRITEQMIELWVNFATTGRPTPRTSDLIPFHWRSVDNATVLRYLNICEDPRMEVALNLGCRYTAHRWIKNKL